ncbi:hypothetical protein KR98_23655 [Ralstonia solanacearum]|nr:hypothetical protein KR98_23655 [Ralstonia solanacearum]OCQ69707.1 hypothetical protein AR465_00775 [Ralstonia solanacearum]
MIKILRGSLALHSPERVCLKLLEDLESQQLQDRSAEVLPLWCPWRHARMQIVEVSTPPAVAIVVNQHADERVTMRNAFSIDAAKVQHAA